MDDTAPYATPKHNELPIINIQNIDMEKVNTFNQKIAICVACEKCIEQSGFPYCEEASKPLAVVANNDNCILGKW